MRTRSVLGIVSIALWFGGLFRVLGEAAGGVVGQLNESAPVIAATVATVAATVVLVSRWSWYRAFLLQSVNDGRSARGLPPLEANELGARIRHGLVLAVWALLPSVVVAVILPTLVAAAIAMVVAMILRVVLTLAGIQTAAASPDADPAARDIPQP